MFLPPMFDSTADQGRSVALPAPFILLGVFYICRKLSVEPTSASKIVEVSGGSGRSRLRRIDFLGSVSIALANMSLLLFLDQIQKHPGNFIHNLPKISALSSCIGFVFVFVGVEAYWAREPILPLRLLVKRNVISAYGIQLFQTASQMAVSTESCSSLTFFLMKHGSSIHPSPSTSESPTLTPAPPSHSGSPVLPSAASPAA